MKGFDLTLHFLSTASPCDPANGTQEWPMVLVHCHICLGSCCTGLQTSVLNSGSNKISRQQQHSIKARYGLFWIWVTFNCASVKLALASTFCHVPSSYSTVPHLWMANVNSLKRQWNYKDKRWHHGAEGSGSSLRLSCTLCILFSCKESYNISKNELLLKCHTTLYYMAFL